MPKVSVIIPTYNRANLVLQAVQSVLNQTYSDYEIILIDDGSTDETRELIEGLDEKVRYIYQDNRGRSSARNRGIQLARGEYVAFLDSDDLFLPDKLEIQVQALAENPSYGMVYSHAEIIDELGKKCTERWEGNLSGYIYPMMLFIKNSFITTPTVMVRSQILCQVGGFDVHMDVCEDLDLWRRIARLYPVLHIKKPLSIIRARKSEPVNISDLVQARKAYYERALNDDPDLGKGFKSSLFSELFSVYGTWAFNIGQRGLAVRLALKALRYETNKIEYCLNLARKCLVSR